MTIEKKWSAYKAASMKGLPDGISREDALFLVELAFYGGAAAELAEVREVGQATATKDVQKTMVKVGKAAALKAKGAH